MNILVEHNTCDKQECHICGKITQNNYFIWLEHLCQHYVAACIKCLPYFREVINETNIRHKTKT